MEDHKTLTRADLANSVYYSLGFSRKECADIVDQVIDTVVDSLCKDEPVKISTFGTFEVRKKNARIGRNPRTGEEAEISQRRVVAFKASGVLKNKIARYHKK